MKIYEFYQDKNFVYIVSELCTGGELFDRITERKRFTEKDAAKLMKQILSCLAYLHQRNIVHRDLKPENILYKEKNADDVNLIDFGLSQALNPNQKLTKKLGTVRLPKQLVIYF
jgi:calcium-dependent protein kinase